MSNRSEEPKGVYQITNLVDNKIYIGSSICIYTRWRNHKLELRKNIHHNPRLQNAWNKYGEDNFEFKILEVVDFSEGNKTLIEQIQEVQALEQKYIDNMCPFGEKGYNISSIASGGKKKMTVEDVLEGRSNYTIEQWNLAIELLQGVNKSIRDIVRETGISKSMIYCLKNKQILRDATEDITFPTRLYNENSSKGVPIKIYQYDIYGNFINSYNSMKSALLSINHTDETSLSLACQNKKLGAFGYIWSINNTPRNMSIIEKTLGHYITSNAHKPIAELCNNEILRVSEDIKSLSVDITYSQLRKLLKNKKSIIINGKNYQYMYLKDIQEDKLLEFIDKN